jgi:hypothetical protein
MATNQKANLLATLKIKNTEIPKLEIGSQVYEYKRMANAELAVEECIVYLVGYLHTEEGVHIDRTAANASEIIFDRHLARMDEVGVNFRERFISNLLKDVEQEDIKSFYDKACEEDPEAMTDIEYDAFTLWLYQDMVTTFFLVAGEVGLQIRELASAKTKKTKTKK